MLITFGDSWVYGVGAGYTYDEPINWEMHEKYTDNLLSDEFINCGFRILLAERMGLQNINFSRPASSNQKQLRYASEYFLRDKNITKNSIVLWGLTSVYRNEFFNTKLNKYENFFIPDSNIGLSKVLSVRYMSEKIEVEKLYYNIELFNHYFKSIGIKNYWFNIFNDHDFPNEVDNILFNGNSLLSVLLNDYEKNDYYHKSVWSGETDRKINTALKNKLVNPYSQHPTKESHSKIANLLYNELQSSASRNT